MLTPIKCILTTNQYGTYCVPYESRHRPVAQYIINGQVWEPETIDFMCENCRDADVVSAGTYFGDFLPPLSAALASGCKIWAFEPHPDNFSSTEWTIRLNMLENVELFGVGLSDAPGDVEFCLTKEGGMPLGGASYVIENAESVRGKENIVVVSVKTLDSIIPEDRDISIIQLDVEKHEQQALAGAMKTIERCRPILIMETLPKGPWIQRNILSLGYKYYGKVHLNSVFSVRPVRLTK